MTTRFLTADLSRVLWTTQGLPTPPRVGEAVNLPVTNEDGSWWTTRWWVTRVEWTAVFHEVRGPFVSAYPTGEMTVDVMVVGYSEPVTILDPKEPT